MKSNPPKHHIRIVSAALPNNYTRDMRDMSHESFRVLRMLRSCASLSDNPHDVGFWRIWPTSLKCRCLCRRLAAPADTCIPRVCVECLFLWTPGPAPPLSGANQRAPKGRPTQTPPRNPRCSPVLESLAAQGPLNQPYVRLPCTGLARARNVSRHWGPPGPATESHVVKH